MAVSLVGVLSSAVSFQKTGFQDMTLLHKKMKTNIQHTTTHYMYNSFPMVFVERLATKFFV